MTTITHAGLIHTGDTIPVGGTPRTVIATAQHADGTVSIHYRPGTGLIHVRPDLQLRNVTHESSTR
jgi:hypothetical protein